MSETRTDPGAVVSASGGEGRSKRETVGAVSDETLVERFLAGGRRDDSVFAELFGRRRLDVWRVCWRFFGNRQDAEDLTQEVFFTVYRKLPQFQGQSSFRTWLHRIAVNTCRNEMRSRSRRPQRAETELEDAPPITSKGESPEEGTIRKQLQARVAQALAGLSEEERRLLEQVEFEELPYAAIAANLGVSVSAVKMRVLRARLALAESHRQLESKGAHSE